MSESPGNIHRDELYTLTEFQRRTGLGAWAIRQARRDGLTVHRIGKCTFVAGADVLLWLEKRNGNTK